MAEGGHTSCFCSEGMRGAGKAEVLNNGKFLPCRSSVGGLKLCEPMGLGNFRLSDQK